MVDGYVYIINDGGILLSFDAESGKLVKRDRLSSATGQYYASPVAGSSKIAFANSDGVLSLVQAGKDWEMLSSIDFEEAIFATPTIHDGMLYVRTTNISIVWGPKKARFEVLGRFSNGDGHRGQGFLDARHQSAFHFVFEHSSRDRDFADQVDMPGEDSGDPADFKAVRMKCEVKLFVFPFVANIADLSWVAGLQRFYPLIKSLFDVAIESSCIT